ncbi:MAG: acyl-CoA thioesterase [Betaproteobacteria bacterium]|nr:acyl-CoA thioesterase [Betaproteobacteria bacterium]
MNQPSTNPKSAPHSHGTGHQVDVGGESYTSMGLRLIMPGDLNAADRLFGGRLMEWVDEIAALFCMTQLSRKQIVTKKISEVIFNEAADRRDVLEFLCRVKNIGRTSITIECLVMTRIFSAQDKSKLIVACDLVFVAIDDQGRPEPHGFAGEGK